MSAANPFRMLVNRVDAGEIAFTHALELARSDVAEKLTVDVVRAAMEDTGDYVNRRDYENALPLLLLIAAALENWSPPHAAEYLWHARVDTVNVAAASLIDVADPAVYQSAMTMGEQLLAAAEKRGNKAQIAMVSRLLGVLNLDPYIVNHTSADYDAAHQRWLLTVAKKKGTRAVFSGDAKLPPPLQALEKAAIYLRKAVDASEGHDRGKNLKALAEAQLFRRVAANQKPLVTPEIVAIAQESIENLDPDIDPDTLAIVEKIVADGGGTVKSELSSDAVGALFRQDPKRALTVVLTQASTREPLQALEWLLDGRPLFDQFGGEGYRNQRWQYMLQFCFDVLKETAPDAAGKPFAQARAILEKKAAGKGPEVLAWSLLGYAANSGAWNGEADGQQAVRLAATLLSHRLSDVDDLLAFSEVMLSLGLGTNAVQAGQWVDSITSYSDALRRGMALGLTGVARDCLERIFDVTKRGSGHDGVPAAVLGGVGWLALSIEALDDAGASFTLRRIIKLTVAAMAAKGKLLTELLHISMLAVKGTRFSRLLASKSGDSGGEELTALLQAVAEAETSAAGEVLSQPAQFFNELVLLGYVSSTERESGDTPGERLRNLQRAFDQRYGAELLRRAGVDPVLFAIDALQERLAPDAVLVNYFLGATPSGSVAVYALMFTTEEQALSVIDTGFPDATVSLGSPKSDGETLAHPIAFIVQSLRQAIEDDPDDGATLTVDGAEQLEKYLPLFFGHLLPAIDKLYARGKRVLYVIPHGPIHFVPFHLLGGENPLADRWTVIAVPNIALVTHDATVKRAANAVASIGMSFDDDHQWGLPAMPEAADEARAIAKIFGREALIDAAATRDAVLSAMRGARYVHISSHGMHNVAAPAFQAIFLAPDATSDGRLLAHEVSALDLRHVELVTLSACETALGRFDEADNLRGLPASFFLAGAGAIIGTLWPAEVDSSRHFFITLYSELAREATIIDAFRVAQQETRKKFPQHRDWGAFYLMRTPVESAVKPLDS